MVAAECVADARQGEAGHFAREVHRHVARQRDLLFAGVAAQHGAAQAVIVGHAVDDQVRRDALGIAHDGDVVQRVRDDLLVDLAAVELGVSVHADERALQLTNVALHAPGDQLEHVVADLDALVLRLLAQDGDTRVKVRLLDVGDQAPLKAGAQALLQAGNLTRRLIGADDDLLAGGVQRVERVEELLLRGIAARDELDIVEHQHVHVAEAVAEFDVLVVLDGGDQLIGEHLAGQVEHAHVRKVILDEVADGVHQVRLAQAHAAVEEQRVVGHARRLRDGQRGRVRKAVGRADDERVKRGLRVERVHALKGRLFLLLLALLPGDALLDAHQLHGHLAPGDLRDRLSDHGQVARADGLLRKLADDLQRQLVVHDVHRLERLVDPGGIGDVGQLLAQQRLCFVPNLDMIHEGILRMLCWPYSQGTAYACAQINHISMWKTCGYPHQYPQDVENNASLVDNFFNSVPMISKKSLVFKGFSAKRFLRKMQLIHRSPADN